MKIFKKKTVKMSAQLIAQHRRGMFIPAAVLQPLTKDMNHASKMNFFLQLLNEIEKWSLCSISQFKVGICAVDERGNLYCGVNVEFPNTAIHTTIHAEQFLVSNVLNSGGNIVGLEHIFLKAPPCGHCRQFLSETLGPELMITVFHDGIYETRELKNLIPFSFGPKDLGVNQSLLKPERDYAKCVAPEQLEEATKWASESELRQTAVRLASERAFAPFTGVHEGCVLVCDDGEVCVGCSVESAAFNPSLMAVQVALIDVYRKGKPLSFVRAAVIVAMRPPPESAAKCPDYTEFAKLLLVSATGIGSESIEVVSF